MSKQPQETIFVTGGAGYIGSHTCKELAKEGFLPVVYDNLSTGHAYAVKWGPFVEGDLNDRAKLDAALALYQPKAVLHFAANALVIESMSDPAKYYNNNVGSTLSLLQAMRAQNIYKLVLSSTCATYGTPHFTPITEEHPQLPINPYGRSKLMLEQILDDFEMAYNFRSVRLRYFNAAGADPETEIGEDHLIETHLIPSIIQTVLKVREDLSVYGSDFPTQDGSAVRDYTHVKDLAKAHVLAVKYLLANEKSLSLNLGTGQGYSVFEIIEAVERHCNLKVPLQVKAKRAGEPAILVASALKAKEVLGWTPEYSDLKTLIASAWKWHELLIENATLLKNTLQRLEKH